MTEPLIVVCSTDPADTTRLQQALRSLALHHRTAGRPLPMICTAAITHAARDRQDPPERDRARHDGQPAAMILTDRAAAGPLLIDVRDAARELGLSQRTLERLVAAGRINSRRIDRRRYFTRADLTGFIRNLDVDRPTNGDTAA